jgi:chitin synthase
LVCRRQFASPGIRVRHSIVHRKQVFVLHQWIFLTFKGAVAVRGHWYAWKGGAVDAKTLSASACDALDIPSPKANVDESALESTRLSVDVAYEWDSLESNRNLIAFNGFVIDFAAYVSAGNVFGEEFKKEVEGAGLDVTRKVYRDGKFVSQMNCLSQRFVVGFMNKESRGCFAVTVVNYTALVIILGLIFIRFSMAVLYSVVVAPKLSKPPTMDVTARQQAQNRQMVRGSTYGNKSPRGSVQMAPMTGTDMPHVLMLVTCYSEGTQSLRNTLESLAATEYEDAHKLLFIVADGLVDSGEVNAQGQRMTTNEIVLSMIDLDASCADPEALPYVAVADGSRQKNMAKVYAGFFKHAGHRVPAVVIVKCGTPEEQSSAKPGNRGKRDSQVLMMNFLSRVMLDDRMTPLEFDLYNKVFYS